MGCDLYEVGILHQERMLIRTWQPTDILKSIPWLKAKNAEGAAIYIRPHGEHRLSLIDDLPAAAIEDMTKRGFQPALIVETSPKNFQVWLDHGRVLAKELSTAGARRLAETFGGDLGSADWRHFGRLAGFTNRKEKHRQPNGLYPFVRLLGAAGSVYDQAPTFVAEVERARENELIASARQIAGAGTAKSRALGSFRLKSIEEFHQDPRYSNDLSRGDLAYCVYALSHGVDEGRIRTALLSRDLSKKGSETRIEDYVRRTLLKAAEAITSVPLRPTQPDRIRERTR
jgi:hypothetical protein